MLQGSVPGERGRGLTAGSLAALLTATALAGPPRYVEVTEERGIEAEHGWTTDSPIAGIAWLNWNDDPWPDLIIAREQGTNTLYANSGPPDFTFEDVSAAAGLSALKVNTTAVLAADLTGDGRDDLLLLPSVHTRSPSLLVGRPDGRFVDETAVRLTVPWSLYVGAASGDPDGDGDLDVALVRWSYRGPGWAGDCLEGHFLENRDGVLTWLPEIPLGGCSFLPAFTDLDDDGDVDLVQLNDYGPLFVTNRVLLSEGTGPDGELRLTPGPEGAGLGIGVYGMGLAVGDFDGDGKRDYYLSSIGEDALLRGDGLGGYEDVTDEWGAGSTLGQAGRMWKWGVAMPDVDNDGHSDLVAMAGAELSPIPLTDPVERSLLLMNSGTPPMTVAGPDAGLSLPTNDRAVATSDLDGDGRVDLAITSATRVRLLHNQTETSGHWLALRLHGTVGNVAGIGARISLTCGGRTWLREVLGGGSPASTHDRLVHVGLGECAGPATGTIRWPGGYEQALTGLSVDTRHELTEPEWLMVSHRQLPAGPDAQVTVRYRPPNGAPTVAIETTHGALTAVETDTDGAYVATLSATTTGVATLTVRIDGQALPAHPRVRFQAAQHARWAHWPARAHPGASLRIGVQLTDGDGQAPAGLVALKLTGATAGPVEHDAAIPAAGWATATVAKSATGVLTAQALLDGAPFGAPLSLTLEPRVDANRSQVFIRPSWAPAGATVKVSVDPVTSTGARWVGEEGSLASSVVLRVNGEVSPASFVADGQSITAYVPAKALMGEVTFEVDGVVLDESVTVRPEAPGPTAGDVSTERSFLAFFDRHLHADGEDIVPLWFVLRNADGQDLFTGTDELARLSLETTGCAPVDGTLFSVDQELFRSYFAFVTPGSEPGLATAALMLDGKPTGLTAEVPVVAAHPRAPSLEHTEIARVDAAKVPLPLPADGASEILLSIIPRDRAGNRTGAGADLEVESDAGAASAPAHRGVGEYWALIRAPSEACTATVRVTSTLSEGHQTFELPFAGPDGATNDRPCADLEDDPGGCSVTARPPSAAGAIAVVALLSLLLMWRLRRPESNARVTPNS